MSYSVAFYQEKTKRLDDVDTTVTPAVNDMGTVAATIIGHLVILGTPALSIVTVVRTIPFFISLIQNVSIAPDGELCCNQEVLVPE